MPEVNLTKDEAEALEDYIWCSLIPFIRDSEEVDNLEWLRLICNVWAKCKDLKNKEGKQDGDYEK